MTETKIRLLWLITLIEKGLCKVGLMHSYSWKLVPGETVKLAGPTPEHATCEHCKRTRKDIEGL